MVDDHTLFRTTLRLALAPHGIQVVGESSPGHELNRLIWDHEPHLIVMEMAASDLQDLQMRSVRVPVLVLTASATPRNQELARQAGAAGFLSKTCDLPDLIRAIQTVAHSQTHFDSTLDSRRPALTERQQRILDGVVHGYTNSEIACQLCVSTGTIKNELRSLFTLFRCEDRTQLAGEAIQSGLTARSTVRRQNLASIRSKIHQAPVHRRLRTCQA